MAEKIVRIVAGSFVLVSILMAHFVNLHWLWLGVFVGVNLVQSSITGFCPLEKILAALGIKGCGCDHGRDSQIC